MLIIHLLSMGSSVKLTMLRMKKGISANKLKRLTGLIETKMSLEGKNQKEVAAIMGITPAALSLILSNSRAIGLDTAIRIAQYLDIPFADVLALAGLDESLRILTGVIDVNIKPSEIKLNTINTITTEDYFMNQAIDELTGLTPTQLKSIITIARTFKESNAPASISDTVTPVTYSTKRGKKQ